MREYYRMLCEVLVVALKQFGSCVVRESRDKTQLLFSFKCKAVLMHANLM